MKIRTICLICKFLGYFSLIFDIFVLNLSAKAREPAVKALVSMFYNYEELARNEEKKTDAILEGENAEKPPTNAPQKVHEDFIEETISQRTCNSTCFISLETIFRYSIMKYFCFAVVQKAGQNMEHTLIAAYVAMTIGYLIIDNEVSNIPYSRRFTLRLCKSFHFSISFLSLPD